jgi:hypothetical protein
MWQTIALRLLTVPPLLTTVLPITSEFRGPPKFLYKFEHCDYKRRLDSGAMDPGIPPPTVDGLRRGHRAGGIRLVTYLDATSM